MTITVFAGSIPEDLLHSDDAKLYIGTVEGFSYEEIPSSPYIKVIALAVKPIEHIKGDVEIGKTITYKDTNFYMNLVEGKDYLIAYLDQHNIYAYEIKSKTNDKVTLVDSDDYDMVQRYTLISNGYLRSIKLGCRKVTRTSLLDFLNKYDGIEDFNEKIPANTVGNSV